MFRQVGVIADTAAKRNLLDLKQSSLLFDKIIVVKTSEEKFDIHNKSHDLLNTDRNNFDWLGEQGVIEYREDPSAELYSDRIESSGVDLTDFQKKCAGYRQCYCGASALTVTEGNLEPIIKGGSNFVARYAAVKMQEETSDTRFIPICFNSKFQKSVLIADVEYPFAIPTIGGYEQVGVSIIEHLPVPSDDTPWENILAFRNDVKQLQRYRKLRSWMENVSADGKEFMTLRNGLESDIDEVREMLRSAKVKHAMKTTSNLVLMAAKFFETIFKLKPSEGLDGISKAALDEREFLDKEQEIARKHAFYIVKAQDVFARS